MTPRCGSLEPDHRKRGCRECGRLFQADWRRRSGIRPKPGDRPSTFVLSPLNIAVNRKYARCQSKGGCIYGRDFILRDGMPVPTCKRCEVPRKPSKWTWSRTAALPGEAA